MWPRAPPACCPIPPNNVSNRLIRQLSQTVEARQENSSETCQPTGLSGLSPTHKFDGVPSLNGDGSDRDRLHLSGFLVDFRVSQPRFLSQIRILDV